MYIDNFMHISCNVINAVIIITDVTNRCDVTSIVPTGARTILLQSADTCRYPIRG